MVVFLCMCVSLCVVSSCLTCNNNTTTQIKGGGREGETADSLLVTQQTFGPIACVSIYLSLLIVVVVVVVVVVSFVHPAVGWHQNPSHHSCMANKQMCGRLGVLCVVQATIQRQIPFPSCFPHLSSLLFSSCLVSSVFLWELCVAKKPHSTVPWQQLGSLSFFFSLIHCILPSQSPDSRFPS